MSGLSDDERGWTFKTIVNGDVYWISFTNKGYARGGDIHDGRQYSVVVKGQFLVKQQYPTEEVETVISTGQSIIIPDGIPHVFIAREDSTMIEWHENPLPPFDKKKYYELYRKLCEAKTEIPKRTGGHFRLTGKTDEGY